MDPDKLWSFAWNAAAKLFNDPDFSEFSDLSSFQRDGKLWFTVLGSQPISGGQGNKYGFYTKSVGEVAVRSIVEKTPLHWTWSQGNVEFAGTVDLEPAASATADRSVRFAGNPKNGLLVLDATLVPSDVSDLLAAYVPYFKSLGFEFANRAPVADIPAFVKKAISQGSLDLLIRDGHSDGDDGNVMVLYPAGYILKGHRYQNGREETFDIIFNLQRKPNERRIPYAVFSELLAERFARTATPLVYFDGSCWGIEKAWFGLGAVPPSQLIEITANTSVNFFENTSVNGMRIVLDGIFKGESFDGLRSRLSDLSGYANNREDRFVFPDDPLYPQGGPIVKVDRKLFSRTAGKAFEAYTPDGYL